MWSSYFWFSLSQSVTTELVGWTMRKVVFFGFSLSQYVTTELVGWTMRKVVLVTAWCLDRNVRKILRSIYVTLVNWRHAPGRVEQNVLESCSGSFDRRNIGWYGEIWFVPGTLSVSMKQWWPCQNRRKLGWTAVARHQWRLSLQLQTNGAAVT